MRILANQAARLYRRRGAREMAAVAIQFLTRQPHYLWFRIAGKPIKVNDKTIRFSVGSNSELSTFNYIEVSEQRLLKDMVGELRRDDIVWDVGANLGVHTLFAAQQVSDGQVISIEPYEPNLAALNQSLNKNSGLAERVKIVNIALSDSDGEMQFAEPPSAEPGNQWTALLFSSDDGSHQPIPTVKTRRGDSLVENTDNFPSPTVVKIDVEGAEPLVIDGMKSALSDCRLCYCEVHEPTDIPTSRPSIEDFGYQLGDVYNQLEKLGFDVEVLDDRKGDRQLKAVR